MKRVIVYIIALAVAFGYAGISIWRVTVEHDSGFWALFLMLGSSTAPLFHECGHALFGLISGVRAKINSKWIVSFYNPSSSSLVPKTDKNLKPRVIVTALGGITINLLFVILGVLSLTVKAIPVWLSGIAVYNIVLLIINAVPIEFSTGKTDGLVICELVKGDDSAKVMLAVLAVQAQILKGKPIEEVDEKLLFDLPQIREDDINFIALTELRAKWYSARGDEDKATQYSARFEQLKEDYLS